VTSGVFKGGVAVEFNQSDRSEPRVNPFDQSFGGVVSRLDGWVWLMVFGLFVIASLVAIFA
jgi:hypothetical protein